jgi:hypothetical protein
MFDFFCQEKLEDLAENAVQSAQKLDISFEHAKIRYPLSQTDIMKKEIEEMEASLVEKETLLQNSLGQVIEWDSILSTFRDAQPAILLLSKTNSKNQSAESTSRHDVEGRGGARPCTDGVGLAVREARIDVAGDEA